MAYRLKLLRGGHDNEFCTDEEGYEIGEVFFNRTDLSKREPDKFELVEEVDDSKLPPTKSERAAS